MAAASAVTKTGRAAIRRLGRQWPAKEVPDGVQSYKKQIVLFPEEGNWHEADPFLLLAEDWIRAPGGFEPHPHRGFETVSIIFNGALRHTDYSRRRKGNSAVVRGLDVQWMRTGRGIVHSEMPDGESDTHMLQLWVNLPSTLKMTKPGHQDMRARSIPILDLGDGYRARVIAGTASGVRGPAKLVHPVVILDVTRGGLDGGIPGADDGADMLDDKDAATEEGGAEAAAAAKDGSSRPAKVVPAESLLVPASFNGFAYSVKGNWVVGGGEGDDSPQRLKHGHAAILPPQETALEVDPASGEASAASAAGKRESTSEAGDEGGEPQSELRLRLAKGTKGRVLVFLGQAISEPVATRGPFVMNTRAQIEQAIYDYQAGKF